MITLHLGIGEGDVQQMTFENEKELRTYVDDIKSYNFKCVWLASTGGAYGEIFIHESLSIISGLILDQYLLEGDENETIHLHEYPTYEDAYKVATDMREGNPLCYGS
jgi:hypothetical protein